MRQRIAFRTAHGALSLKSLFAHAKANPVPTFACLFAAAWLILDNALLQPALGGVDIYFFKEPGLNLAEGLGFTTRFTYGNPTFAYAPYSHYPPVYPLLFALWVKLFGATVQSNQLFNSLLSTLAGIMGFLALRPALKAPTQRMTTLLLCGVFALTVAVGLFQPEFDRPDALAVSVCLLALILVRSDPDRRRLFLAGAVCAAAFFISPFIGAWAALAAAVLVAAQCRRLDEAVGRGLVAATGAGLVGLVALALIAVFLPGWFSAFAGVATGSTPHKLTGTGYFLSLLHGDVKGWLEGFSVFFRFNIASYAELIVAQAAVLGAILWERARTKLFERHVIWPAALLGASLLTPIVFPYQSNYYRITAALLLVATAGLTLKMSADSQRRFAAAVTAGFIVLSAPALPNIVREQLVRTTTGPSLQRAKAYLDRHRTEFEGHGQLFAVDHGSYMLWREEGLHPLATGYPSFEAAENRARLSRVALNYTGSGDPMTPSQPGFWSVRGEFALTDSPALPQVPRIFGIKLAHSSNTWETAIYTRVRK